MSKFIALALVCTALPAFAQTTTTTTNQPQQPAAQPPPPTTTTTTTQQQPPPPSSSTQVVVNPGDPGYAPPPPRTTVRSDEDVGGVTTAPSGRSAVAIIATDALYGGVPGAVGGAGITLIDNGNHWAGHPMLGAGIATLAGAGAGGVLRRRRVRRDGQLALAVQHGAPARSVRDDQRQPLAQRGHVQDLGLVPARLQHVDGLRGPRLRRPQDHFAAPRHFPQDGLRVREHDPADLAEALQCPERDLPGDGAGEADVPCAAKLLRLEGGSDRIHALRSNRAAISVDEGRRAT